MGVAASEAQAFQGESVVVKPGGGLTGPAKTIIEKPTFLPEVIKDATSVRGVAEGSRVAGVFQGASVLPALGAVVSFGVGTVIGSEICNVIGIEGCWYFGSEGADPAVGTETGEWIYIDEGITYFAGMEEDNYVWEWSAGAKHYVGYFGNDNEGCRASPGGVTHTVEDPEGTPNACGGLTGFLLRHSMENRTVDYHATDDPEVGNYAHSADEDWDDQLADAVEGASGESPAGRLGERVAAEIEGSEVADPYGSLVTVPSCDELAWEACRDLLEESELEPVRQKLGWEGAVIEKGAGAVLELKPASGSELETGTTVTVTTNPDPEEMPLLVPAVVPGQEYGSYVATLDPRWQPSKVVLSPEFSDPTVGPNEVSGTNPATGTRADPQTEPGLEVRVNPSDAPPATGTTPYTPPAIPAVDLSPLAGIAVGCNDFPFGIFCWFADGLSGWGTSGQCPDVDVPLGSSANVESGLPFDFCKFEPAMEVVRPIIVLVSAFCMAYLFAAAAMGFGGSTSED